LITNLFTLITEIWSFYSYCPTDEVVNAHLLQPRLRNLTAIWEW